jgi:hypothetical protein
MKPVRRVRISLVAAALVLTCCICYGLQAAKSLIINGQVATTDVRTINGRTYAPLADIAKALNMTLVNQPGSIAMVPAGGANQVSGLRGKIGDTLFTGKWKLMPLSLQQVDTYTTKYEGDQETYKPRNDGETLYVLTCRIKNAQTSPMEMVFTQRSCGNTALADDQEHSFGPFGFDAHNETGPYGGPKMLPGSAAEFAVIFSAPKGTVPKDVILSVISGDDLLHTGKGTDFRISVKQ